MLDIARLLFAIAAASASPSDARGGQSGAFGGFSSTHTCTHALNGTMQCSTVENLYGQPGVGCRDSRATVMEAYDMAEPPIKVHIIVVDEAAERLHAPSGHPTDSYDYRDYSWAGAFVDADQPLCDDPAVRKAAVDCGVIPAKWHCPPAVCGPNQSVQCPATWFSKPALLCVVICTMALALIFFQCWLVHVCGFCKKRRDMIKTERDFVRCHPCSTTRLPLTTPSASECVHWTLFGNPAALAGLYGNANI